MLPQRPPILHVLSSHSTLATKVTRVWPLHLVVAEPGQDVDLSPSPAALHPFIKPLWNQIFLGFGLKRTFAPHAVAAVDGAWSSVAPPALRDCSCLCQLEVVPGCSSPRLYLMQGPNLSMGQRRMSSESTVQMAFCAFPLISFLKYFLLPGSLGHTYCIPTVDSLPFSSHHPACEGDPYLLHGIRTLLSSVL